MTTVYDFPIAVVYQGNKTGQTARIIYISCD